QVRRHDDVPSHDGERRRFYRIHPLTNYPLVAGTAPSRPCAPRPMWSMGRMSRVIAKIHLTLRQGLPIMSPMHTCLRNPELSLPAPNRSTGPRSAPTSFTT